MIQFDIKYASTWERFKAYVIKTDDTYRNWFLIALIAFVAWAFMFG